MACPTLYPGQTIQARVEADSENESTVMCRLFVGAYGAEDKVELARGPSREMKAGAKADLSWTAPDTGGCPIENVGIEIVTDGHASGAVYLDSLTWSGMPRLTLTRPKKGGKMWERAWVNGADRFGTWKEPFRIVHNEGRGLVIQGTREWKDYRVSAEVTIYLASSAGIAARVQGMRRFYSLVLTPDGKARLAKSLDGDVTLAEIDFPWQLGSTHSFVLQVTGSRIEAEIDGKKLPAVSDSGQPLSGGAVAFVCADGWITSDAMRVEPV